MATHISIKYHTNEETNMNRSKLKTAWTKTVPQVRRRRRWALP